MIEIKNISKIYKTGDFEYQALKSVSFKIDNGEFVAIMGPSGSGKSTLMHILGCLDTPTNGTYLLNNKDVSKLLDNELADIRKNKIGFVFQTFNLLPRTSVLRNVMLPLVYAGENSEKQKKEAERALRAVALPEEFWNHRSNQLSCGMIQKVAIARALINNPTLILADEPTGNLDTKTAETVLNTFQQLHMKHGQTIVLITHEQYVAEYAERIIHIRDGAIINDEKVKHRKITDHH